MIARRRRLRTAWADLAGALTVEFALILPAFVMVLVGGFYGCDLMFVASSMQYASQAAARCASVQATVCTDSTSIVAYANSHFAASGVSAPTFSYSASGCGHVVSASYTYVLDTGMVRFNVPLSSTACFP